MKPSASDPSTFGPDEIDPLELEALHDLLDERLDAAASAALRARLEREPALRAAWRELRELRELLREEWSDETPTPLDPRALADRVLERARELAPAAPASAPPIAPTAAPVLRRARWFRFGLSFVAAASVCAAAVWLASLPQESAPAALSAKVEERSELADELAREEEELLALRKQGRASGAEVAELRCAVGGEDLRASARERGESRGKRSGGPLARRE
ncbi:MAG: hypothetical protein IPN34_25530 [Planctomycetes bacterium]|nr:hypothetical protein [Planctomycetota bacterium]